MPGQKSLTVAEVEERFEEAALTMKRLPTTRGPKGFGSSWPPYIQSRFTAYGSEAARVRVIPSAVEIQRMENVVEWLRLIGSAKDQQNAAMDRKIVWLRAENLPWRAICGRVGLSRSQAWRRWRAALITVQRRLAAGPGQTGKGWHRNATTLNAEGGGARNRGGQKRGGRQAAESGSSAARGEKGSTAPRP